MPNKTDSAKTTNTFGGKTNSSKLGATGIYGAKPDFPEYKQSMGKDTIPIKFQESGIQGAKRMTNMGNSAASKQVTQRDTISPATRIGGKNRYDSVKGGKK
jgi:hypothetical protein